MPGTCGYGEGLSGSINAGNFLTSCRVYWLASQEGLCSMEQVYYWLSIDTLYDKVAAYSNLEASNRRHHCNC